MKWRLIAQLGSGPQRFELREGENIVGSDRRAFIRLAEPTVSRRHARILVEGERLVVEDLGSRNGTWLGRRRLEEPVRLAAGTMLVFATVPTRLEIVADEDVEAALLFELSGKHATVEEDTVETAGVSLLELFVLDRLPTLIDEASGGADDELAARLEEHLDQLVPGKWREAREAEACRETVGRRAIRLREDVDTRVAAPIVESLAGLWRLAERLERPTTRNPTPETTPPPLPEPATKEASIQRLYHDAHKVAQGEISVLILGETGTGKEVLARWIHGASPRAEGPFLALNCAALPAELLEAELFGVEKGVATGVEARPGKLELAAGGTLFLDEVGDAPPSLQAKLLRVLQERMLYRLGAAQPTPVDVRVLAATHHDPEAQVESGDLRLDLYHRLADWTARVPPLRRRRTDLPQLAGYFLRGAARKLDKPVRGISQGALTALLAYDWPGNIRELKQEMERAALLLGPGELLDRPRLSSQIQDAKPQKQVRGRLDEELKAAERRHIRRALDEAKGDRPRAAERLGISPATLYRRLKALELDEARAGA